MTRIDVLKEFPNPDIRGGYEKWWIEVLPRGNLARFGCEQNIKPCLLMIRYADTRKTIPSLSWEEGENITGIKKISTYGHM